LLGPECYEGVMTRQPSWQNSVGGWLIWHCNLNLQLPPLDTVHPDITPQLASIIGKMIEKSCERRYSEVTQIMQDLKILHTARPAASSATLSTVPCSTTLPTEPFRGEPQRTSAPTEFSHKRPSKRWSAVMLAALGLLLLFGLLLWQVSRERGK